MKTQIQTTESARIPTPSKADEIAILREAARQLGPLSYCGPWLSQQIAGIEKDIGSDFFPQIDLNTTARHCADMARQAGDECTAKIESANKQAAEILRVAHTEACSIRGRVLNEIRHCQTTLGVIR